MRFLVLVLCLLCLAFFANALGGAWALLMGKSAGLSRIIWGLPLGLLSALLALYLTKRHSDTFF